MQRSPKVEIAKIMLSFAPSVFAKNISPAHRFGGYFLDWGTLKNNKILSAVFNQ